MTITDYSCLELLAQRPGLSNSELARGAFVARQSMNVLLQALERQGLVTRPAQAPVGRALPTELTARAGDVTAPAFPAAWRASPAPVRSSLMSAPVVRIAAAADAPAVAALRRAWTAEWYPGDGGAGDEGFEARFLDWYQREAARRVTWLAELSGEPAGMVNLTVFERMPQPGRDPGSWGYLGNAYVLPAHRDQGIGSRLLRALLGYTDARGYARVVLNPSERSGPLYRRFGFSAEHGLLVRRLPALAGRVTSAGQRSPWYSAGGPSCAPSTGANAAE